MEKNIFKEITSPFLKFEPVEAVWQYECNHPTKPTHILPDACFDIIFDLYKRKAFLVGIMSKYKQRQFDDKKHLVGVRIKAEYLRFFTAEHANEFKDSRIPIDDIAFKLSSNQLLNQLEFCENFTERVNCIEKYLFQEIPQAPSTNDLEKIVAIASYCRQHPRNLDIQSLAQKYFISLRQLERKFKQVVGLSLRSFLSILKFNSTALVINQSPHQSLKDIAFQNGYFDPSHMNHHFHHLAGLKPSAFRH